MFCDILLLGTIVVVGGCPKSVMTEGLWIFVYIKNSPFRENEYRWGGDNMHTYEILSIVLTVMSIVTLLLLERIKNNKK